MFFPISLPNLDHRQLLKTVTPVIQIR